FLHERSLERLRIFISPTCVSFSTVTRLVRHRLFSAVLRGASGSYVPSLLVGDDRLAGRPPSGQRPDAFNRRVRRGNINPLSIDYAFRPRLRHRLTLGGFTFPRKP